MNTNKHQSHQNGLLQRNAILLQLEAAHPTSLAPGILIQGLLLSGHSTSIDLLDKHLDYLLQKQLLTNIKHQLSPSLSRFKITASGLDYLEQEGLA